VKHCPSACTTAPTRPFAGWALSRQAAEVEETAAAAASAEAAAAAAVGSTTVRDLADLDADLADLEREARTAELARDDLQRRQGRIKVRPTVGQPACIQPACIQPAHSLLEHNEDVIISSTIRIAPLSCSHICCHPPCASHWVYWAAPYTLIQP
jgi:hypothetical protein